MTNEGISCLRRMPIGVNIRVAAQGELINQHIKIARLQNCLKNILSGLVQEIIPNGTFKPMPWKLQKWSGMPF